MISEYHINRIVEKLDAIIKNQEEILKAVRSNEQIVVESVPHELEIAFEEAKKADPVLPKKSNGTGQFKDAFQLYKKKGGKLSWNAWLKAGRPK